MIEAYRAGADDAGREPGEVLLHASFSWAPDDEAALRGASAWRATLVPDYFTDDWHDPVAMQERARREISDERVRSSFIVSSDPEEHAERIREVERLGATIVVLMNISGEAPVEAVDVYGREVLPRLRGGRGGAARRGTRAASA
jgi:coenzyme F420-dependent glucose-6-phosphate dehydrogenase